MKISWIIAELMSFGHMEELFTLTIITISK
jgi:hypothetical protein